MVRTVAISCSLALLLAGCKIGPTYQRPEVAIPDSFRGQTEPPGSDSVGDLGWWEVYHDPVLDELIASALKQNFDVKIAAARVAEARALVGVSRLAQLPQIGVNANGQKARTLVLGNYGTATVYSAVAQASFELDLWGRLASLSDEARANLLATEFARDAVKASLVGDVATAYFNLLALDEQYRVTERTIGTREKFLELTRAQYRRGVVSGLDVDRADASLAGARAALPDLGRLIEQTENQLQILLGQNPGPIARKMLDLDALPIPPAVPSGLPSALLERRPDLRQAESQLVAATADVRATKAALFPTISLTGNYGFASLELGKLFTGTTAVWSYGLSALQPILDAQRNGYRVDAAQARRDQATLQYQSAVVSAFRDVADALAARRAAADALTEQTRQVRSLEAASQRVLKRYGIGFSSYFEVIDADSNLFTAELLLVQAYRNAQVAVVQLYKALGGGWQEAASPTP